MFKTVVNLLRGKRAHIDLEVVFADSREALHKRDYETALSNVSEYLSSKDTKVREEANRLVAMALFRLERYRESVPHYQAVVHDTQKIIDWFNLVMASTLAGNVDIAESAILKLTDLHRATQFRQRPSMPEVQYYYACALRDVGAYEKALVELNKLRSLYEHLHITDSTFLHIRNVPFLSDVMSLVVDVLNGLHDIDGQLWMSEFSQKVDDDGKSVIGDARLNLFAVA